MYKDEYLLDKILRQWGYRQEENVRDKKYTHGLSYMQDLEIVSFRSRAKTNPVLMRSNIISLQIL